ncbi:MAG TPA: hypothetical protein VGR16_08810 [Thermomicrobiales bacterium]|nr:hypothetical protein [Thermomicrobiales bacterium]
MSVQTLLWFGIAGGALLFAGSLLHARYIRKEPRAVASGGSYMLFALLMLLLALGAAAAGLVAGSS